MTPGDSEGLQGADVGGLLDDDGVARVEEDPGDQVETLLRTRHHEHVRGPGTDAARRHPPREGLPQWAVTFGRAVEEERRADIADELGGILAQRLKRQKLRSRQTDRERDNVPALGHCQKVGEDRVVGTRDALAEKLAPRHFTRAGHRCRRAEDGGTAAHVGVHQTEGLELAIGIEHGRPIDTERRRQASLGRQPEALGKRPGVDQPPDLLYHLAVDRLVALSVDGDIQL